MGRTPFGKTTLLSEWAASFRLPIVDSELETTQDEQIQNPKSPGGIWNA